MLRDPFRISVRNFVKIGQTVAEISRFLLFFFQDVGRRHVGFSSIRYFYGRSPVGDQHMSLCQISSKSVTRLQRYGDFTVFKMVAVHHLGFVKFEVLTVGAVKGATLHQHTKFHKDRSNRCGDIAIFVIFQDGGRRHLGFSKIRNFNNRSAVRVQYASLYQVSAKSVKRLQRYGDLTVFFKMAAVRHLGFVGRLLGPPTTTTLWSPSLCKIWSKSMQEFR